MGTDGLIVPEIVVKSIDNSNNKKLGRGYLDIKDLLKADLQHIFEDVKEGKRTPEEYKRYMLKCKELFEKNNGELKALEKKYDIARQHELSLSERGTIALSRKIEYTRFKTRNLLQDLQVNIEQRISSEVLFQGYTKDKGNFNISLKDFENQLISRPIENLNGLALKNYLIYLKEKGVLSKNITLNDRVILEKKLGGGQKGKDRLLELSVIWSSKFENEFHKSNSKEQGGGWVKMKTAIKGFESGFRENKIENFMFKEIIMEEFRNSANKKNNGPEGKKGSIETRKLVGKYGALSYEDMIKDMMKEFLGNNPSGADVLNFFKKELTKIDSQIKNLEQEKKKGKIQLKEIGNHTLSEVLKRYNIPLNIDKKTGETKINALIKNSIALNDIQTKLTELSFKHPENTNITELLKAIQIENATCDLRDKKSCMVATMQSDITLTTIAMDVAGGAGGRKLDGRKLETVMRTAKKVQDSSVKLEQSLVKTKIPGFESTEQIRESMKDYNKIINAINYLEHKGNLTKEEQILLKDLNNHKKVKELENAEYEKAKRGLSDDKYAELVASGLINVHEFADTKVPKIVEAEKTNNLSGNTNKEALSGKGNNIEIIGGTITNFSDKYFTKHKSDFLPINGVLVKRIGKGEYIVGNEKCNEKELPTMINSIKFLESNGLKRFSSDMPRLMNIFEDSPFISHEAQISFDAKKGFGPAEQKWILKGFQKLLLPEDKNTDVIEISKKLNSFVNKGKMDLLIASKGLFFEGKQEVNYESLKNKLV